jgi:cytidylate kinase
MGVIAISREFGSEGNALGAQVAKSLGYHLIFKKEIAGIFEQYGVLAFDEIYHADVNFWVRFDSTRKTIMNFLSTVIQGVAQYGNVVIVGRCGCEILKDFSGVLKVRVQAPLPIKVERIRQENITAPEKVEQLVLTEDENRAKLVHMFYNVNWDDPHNFDLMVDTGKISVELAAKWILEIVEALEMKAVSPKPVIAATPIDSILRKVIAEVLEKS